MSFDISAIAANPYKDESGEIIAAAINEGRTVKKIDIQFGIKTSSAINILKLNPSFQNGNCALNSITGSTTTLSQRFIEVSKISSRDSLCVDELEDIYTQLMMKQGSWNEELPFSELYAKQLGLEIENYIEQLVWVGDTALPVSNPLSKADGLLKVIDAEASVIKVTGATDVANIVATVDKAVTAIPNAAIASKDLTIFVSFADYRTYSTALRNSNLFAYTGAENQGGEFTQMVPGTNVTIFGVEYMPVGEMVLAEASNLVAGTDLLSSMEDIRVFFDEKEDKLIYDSKFKFGTNVKFPERIIKVN